MTSSTTHAVPPAPWYAIWTARWIYFVTFILGYIYYDSLQNAVDVIWAYVSTTWVFNCSYFETWWTAVLYPPILVVPIVMDKIRWFDRFKMDPSMRWRSMPVLRVIVEAVIYMIPLLVMDTFMVKRYRGIGIDPHEWTVRAENWIQHTRAIPLLPPTVLQIVSHIVVSFILYDFFFFLVHFAFHKNLKLYQSLHKYHHDHEHVNSKVTNQLHIVERIALVLSANQALRIMHAHPLTRAIFVPCFLGWLVENHCGYDLPWTLNKVVPLGLVGGSPAHFAHHQYGERHYQPFFTYIDRYLGNTGVCVTKRE